MTNMEDHCDSTYWNKSNLTIIFSISILEEQNTKTKTDAGKNNLEGKGKSGRKRNTSEKGATVQEF